MIELLHDSVCVVTPHAVMRFIEDKQGNSTQADKAMHHGVKQNTGRCDHDPDILENYIPDSGTAPMLNVVRSTNQSALVRWQLFAEIFVLLLGQDDSRSQKPDQLETR